MKSFPPNGILAIVLVILCGCSGSGGLEVPQFPNEPPAPDALADSGSISLAGSGSAPQGNNYFRALYFIIPTNYT